MNSAPPHGLHAAPGRGTALTRPVRPPSAGRAGSAGLLRERGSRRRPACADGWRTGLCQHRRIRITSPSGPPAESASERVRKRREPAEEGTVHRPLFLAGAMRRHRLSGQPAAFGAAGRVLSAGRVGRPARLTGKAWSEVPCPRRFAPLGKAGMKKPPGIRAHSAEAAGDRECHRRRRDSRRSTGGTDSTGRPAGCGHRIGPALRSVFHICRTPRSLWGDYVAHRLTTDRVTVKEGVSNQRG